MLAFQHWNGPERDHYSSRTEGAKTKALFESLPGPLLTSGMRPLDRYGTRQETISRRPEQMFLHLTQGREWLGRGYYSGVNEFSGQSIIGSK